MKKPLFGRRDLAPPPPPDDIPPPPPDLEEEFEQAPAKRSAWDAMESAVSSLKSMFDPPPPAKSKPKKRSSPPVGRGRKPKASTPKKQAPKKSTSTFNAAPQVQFPELRRRVWSPRHQKVIDWFQAARTSGLLPASEFQFKPWIKVLVPEKFYTRLEQDISRGPGGSANVYDVLLTKLEDLKEFVEGL